MALIALKCRKTKARTEAHQAPRRRRSATLDLSQRIEVVACRLPFRRQAEIARGRTLSGCLRPARARIARDNVKLLLEQGSDPSHQRRLERLEHESPGDTFEVVAMEYLAKLGREQRSAATLKKVGWLLDFALGGPGPLKVRDIRPVDVLGVLQRVERRGRHETFFAPSMEALSTLSGA